MWDNAQLTYPIHGHQRPAVRGTSGVPCPMSRSRSRLQVLCEEPQRALPGVTGVVRAVGIGACVVKEGVWRALVADDSAALAVPRESGLQAIHMVIGDPAVGVPV